MCSATVDKLVRAYGYPPALYDLDFDYNFMMRGLIVDKKRGNIIKVTRVGRRAGGCCAAGRCSRDRQQRDVLRDPGLVK
jgi:hypothetical protein